MKKHTKIPVRAAGDITYADALRLRPGSAEEKLPMPPGTGRSFLDEPAPSLHPAPIS